MNLKYRGNSYEYRSSVLKTVESNMTAKFRGISYNIKETAYLTVPQSIVNLKFRGIPYIKGKNSQALPLKNQQALV